MATRRTLIGRPSEGWAVGAARFWVDREQDGFPLSVSAFCRLGSGALDDFALIDTGAAWSLIGGDLARVLAPQTFDLGIPMSMSTRLGLVRGSVHRLPVTLLADEGSDVTVDASVMLSLEWSGPVVLGYRGFLERIRIAFDPGVGDDDQRISFALTSA